MKRTRLFGLSLLLAAALFVGCDNKESDPPAIKVENEQVLTQTVYADETNGKSGVTFVTAGAWTSTITEGTVKSAKAGTTSWVSIDPGHGDAAGTYTITISLEPNATGEERTAVITITCNGVDITITVTQKGTKEDGGIPVSGVTLNKTALTLETGDKETLMATVQPDNAANKAVTWSSSNDGVASISSTGEVTAKAVGSAIITVKTDDGNKTATCAVTVTEPTNQMTLTFDNVNFQRFFLRGTGTVTIDWGDGTAIQKLSLSGSSTDCNHAYSSVLSPVITVKGGNVTDLSIYNSSLLSLDVSRNVALKSLTIKADYPSTVPLTALDVSRNTALTDLTCFRCKLTSLDVSRNVTLERLDCSYNQLTKLDVSKNTMLMELVCSDNQLTKLDVSKNTMLKKFTCGYNQLTELDVSKNTVLVIFSCDKNQLTELDVSTNSVLQILYCPYNQLSSAALNALFSTLHNNTVYSEFEGVLDNKVISIDNNPGTSDCDKKIAEDKGWRFY